MSYLSLTPEHIEAANKIVVSFTTGRWSILIAQMQSGKTFTFLLACAEMIRNNMISNVIVFSGNAETDLKGQLKNKIQGNDDEFYEAYDEYLETFGIGRHERRTIRNDIKAKMTVLWGSELKKIADIPKKTLIIWEEAHYAQNITQGPDKFLHKIRVSADGDSRLLAENGNYVISVSATPFSELSDNIHHSPNKKVVYLKPGEKYTSVQNIRDSGRLKAYKDIVTALTTALKTPHTTNKYALVRISHKNEEKVIDCIKQNGWRYVIYDSLSSMEAKNEADKTWTGMSNAPSRDTVILLRGKCRMGKNLEKTHVLFVMETARTSATDTILQGLLGRVCGYSQGSDQIDVYLHEKIVNSGEIDRYIDMVNKLEATGEITVLPTHANNIEHPHKGQRVTLPIIPIAIKRTSKSNDKKDIQNDIYNAFVSENSRISNKNSPEILEEISNRYKELFQNGKKHINMCYISKNKTSRNEVKLALLEDSYKNSVARDFGGGCGNTAEIHDTQINIWTNKDIANHSNDIIYITSVVKNKNLTDINSIEHRIPRTTMKEVFCHKLEDGTNVVSNGGFVIHLPISSASIVKIMKQYVVEFIELSKTYTSSRRITSQWCSEKEERVGILVTPEVEQSLLPGGEIYATALEMGYDIELTVAPPKMEDKYLKNYKRYASISW